MTRVRGEKPQNSPFSRTVAFGRPNELENAVAKTRVDSRSRASSRTKAFIARVTDAVFFAREKQVVCRHRVGVGDDCANSDSR
jgi:hypothetical protein